MGYVQCKRVHPIIFLLEKHELDLMNNNKVSDEKENENEYLLSYNAHLEKELRNLERKKQHVEGEKMQLERDLDNLRNAIDRLREPPLVGAVVIKRVRGESGRYDEDKYLVMSSVGVILCVNINPELKDIKLESGAYVLLDQRTFAIMEVLSLTREEVLSAADKLAHLYQVFDQ